RLKQTPTSRPPHGASARRSESTAASLLRAPPPPPTWETEWSGKRERRSPCVPPTLWPGVLCRIGRRVSREWATDVGEHRSACRRSICKPARQDYLKPPTMCGRFHAISDAPTNCLGFV